ncbi:MAG: glycosyltransferase [Azoarcus sp.]|jgi:glycosyltransferase involved in cell wall biosynthesis|nr:glycosyltransferase [Azoarcus sp.]
MRIVFLIRSLEIGGAEQQLVTLARVLHARGETVTVLTFYPGGALRDELAKSGVPVADLGKRGRWDAVAFFGRLWKTLSALRPDVLYSFLTTANILGLWAGRLAGIRRIVWGMRVSLSHKNLSCYGRLERVESRLAAALARFANHIVCNSLAGLGVYVGMGYPEKKCSVIENGIDTRRFVFDPAGRERLRGEWGVAEDVFLVGYAARLVPIKNHPAFLRAVKLCIDSASASDLPVRMRFVCVGEGAIGEGLRTLATQMGLGGAVLWAGERQDMPSVYSAFDIAVSSSSSEGFSNAISEAMSCSVPCAVTDVGDSARIVGGTGWIVPPGDEKILARAWQEAAALPREALAERGRAARHRIETEYSVERMAAKTLEVLQR